MNDSSSDLPLEHLESPSTAGPMSVRPPQWVESFFRQAQFRPCIVLYGRVKDEAYFRTSMTDDWRYRGGITPALFDILNTMGYSAVTSWDPVRGFKLADRSMEAAWNEIRQAASEVGEGALDAGAATQNPQWALERVRTYMSQKKRSVATVIDFASVALGDNAGHGEVEKRLGFLRATIAAQDGTATVDEEGVKRRNLLVLLAGQLGDIPDWLWRDNPRVATIAMGLPTREERELLIRDSLVDGVGVDVDISEVARLTDGMGVAEVQDLTELLADPMLSETIEVSDDPSEGARAVLDYYRYGLQRSGWDDPDLLARVAKAEATLNAEVKGQKEAVHSIAGVLARAVQGLSSIHSAGRRKSPRGVLFFAGPTGVGKTMAAKTIAKIVFGDEDRLLTFDMSEYSHEHHEAKLLGAPPGYVGFHQGGQLTEAIEANPFRVVLFDEMEKAHERIFDKFLQILAEGRVTDGQGKTVSFADTIIVFTSNAGMFHYRNGEADLDNPRITPDTHSEYSALQADMVEGIDEFFESVLGRPELLGRLGRENVIAFNFVRDEVLRDIQDETLKETWLRVAERTGLQVAVSPEVDGWVYDQISADYSLGVRNLGNLIEANLVNPLSLWMIKERAGGSSLSGRMVRIDPGDEFAPGGRLADVRITEVIA